MPSINDLRSALGPASEGRSDEELLSAYAQASGQHPNQVAMEFGYNPSGSGKWGNRTSASVDNAQAQLYGVAEAMGLGNWARRGRVSNKFQADVAQGRARAQGAIMGMDDIKGITDIPEYVGGLAIDSAPQMGTTFAAGLAGGLPAAAAVGYGFATGDVLENQREQSGKTDLLSAGLLAIPYAAVDTFSGVGKLAAKGKLAKSGLRALDNMQGVGGAAARAAASMGRTAVEEGVGETFQEGMNQLGRMAVDPNAQFMSPDAQKRYLESFVGGAALGGFMGGVGGHRRSDSYRSPDASPVAPQGQVWDGTAPNWSTTQGFDPRLVQDKPNPLGDVTPDWNLQDYVPGKADEGKLSFFEAPNWNLTQGYEGAKQINAKARLKYTPVEGTVVDPAGLPNNRPDPRVPRGWDGTVPEWGTAQGVTEITQQPHPGQYYAPDWQTTQGFAAQEAPGPTSPLGIITPDLGLTEHAQDNYGEKLPFHQATTADEEFGLLGADKNNGNYKPIAKAPEEVGPVVPPMTELPNYGPLDVDGAKKRHAEKVVAQEQAARKAAIRKDMAEKGIPQSKQAYELYTQMHELREKGVISDKAFVDAISDLYDKSDYHNARRFVKGVTEIQAAKDAAKTENAGEEGTTAPGSQGQVQASTGAIAGIDPNKVATIGRKGREQQVTPQALLQKLASATPEEKQTILAVTGLELDRDPTTGAARLLPTREPMTFADAAKQLGVSPQALQQRLAKFGITKDVVDRATGEGALQTEEVSGEEIGLNPEGAVEGFRIEGDLSKAAGQGLVSTAEDARMTPEQRKAKAGADAILAEAGPSGAVEPTLKAPEGATVTDLRDGNASTVEANIRAMIESPAGQKAALWWDGAVAFETLPDTLKADWIEEILSIIDTYGSLETANDAAFSQAERSILESYAQYQANQVRSDSSRDAVSAEPAEGRPRIAGANPESAAAETAGEAGNAGSGSYVGEAGGRVGPATTPVVTTKKKRTIQKPAEAQMSQSEERQGSTVARVMTEISQLKLGLDPKKVRVVQSVADLPKLMQASLEGKQPQGFVLGGRAVLIADNIRPGNARSVLMHEIGVHMGLENLLSAKEFGRLANKIVDWADANDGSIESVLARKAIARVGAAGTRAHQVHSETVAYMVEEAVRAGIDPTALRYKSDLGRWMAELIRLLKAGLAKLKLIDAAGLTAQDVVDMAYGAAKLEMQVDQQAATPKMSVDTQFSIDDHIPEKLKPAADTVASVAKDMAKNGLKKAMFTKDLAQQASKMLPSATKYVSLVSEAQAAKMKKEREIAQILEGYDKLPLRERGTGPASVNAFLQESTMEKAWGYKPEYHADAKVDPKMEAKFKALSPEAQALVKAVFKHGHENLLAMQKAVTDNIASEYDAVIAEAQKAGDEAGVEKAKADKVKSLRDYEGLMGQGGNWPYAPLKRFGNQVVVGMSQAYMDAVKAGDKELIRSMQDEGKHYMVEFAETRREAIARRKELEQSGQFANVQDFERDDAVQALHGRDVLSAFGRLRNLVDDSEVSAETAKALRGMMTDLHLSLLSERSALQSGRFRKNVAGADKDMMRAFATQGRATAHFIANLENSDKINETLGMMREEADDVTANDRRERRDYYNELMRRHAMNMEYKPSPLIEKAMKASSVWMLLTSPAHFLVNATQPYVVSLPVMAGRHGYARSAAALSKAYRELAPLLKDGKLTSEDYKHLPADVREAVNSLTDRGFIDISLERELGETNTGAFDSVVSKLRKVSETVEHINRLSTAIAAVRLEREANPGAGNDAHIAYAGKIINDTHGDYSGFNAPRVMRSGVGRLMTQFRKYQLIQISMYTRLLHAAFKGATPQERTVGRKALAFSLGHMAVLGGALGMPGAQFIGAILRTVFGDDDEPDNPELTLRKMIGDETTADLLLKGVPKVLGVDLSGRLGAGGMLSLLPYADVSMDRKGYEAAVMGALGPFLGGLMPNIADGAGKIGQGKYYEGIAKMLPKGFADAYKGFHVATEGLTQKNGDQIMSPEEVTLVDAFFQAMGLPTNTLTDRTFRANAKYELDSFYKDKMGQMKAKYVKAYREGDAQAMQEVRDNWAQLDAARKANGYKPAGLQELLKAPAESKKREAHTQGNLQYRAKDRGTVQMLDDLS